MKNMRKNVKTKPNKKKDRGIWMKGYILTISALLLFSLVITFAKDTESIKQQMKNSYHNAVQISKLNYFVEDISGDLANIISVDYTVKNVTVGTCNLTIIENVSINKSQFFSNYAPFLQAYSNVTGANISLSYSDPLIVNFSNNFYYSSLLNNSMFYFANKTGSTPATAYYITLVSKVVSQNFNRWSWDASGTYVVLKYTEPDDRNNFEISGYLNPAQSHTSTLNYPGAGQINIIIAPVGASSNTVNITQTEDQLTFYNLTASVPLVEYASYNPILSVSYLDANFSATVPA